MKGSTSPARPVLLTRPSLPRARVFRIFVPWGSVAMADRSQSRLSSHRRGFSYVGLAVALLLLLAVGAVGWSAWPKLGFRASVPDVMTHAVARGEFVHEITDHGEVESTENVEVRCEVKSGYNKGTIILEIVPEGTQVKGGDKLVVLDSSALEVDRTKQQIVVSNSEAVVIQARNVLDTAKIAKKEYLEGKYLLERQEILSRIVMKEEDLRRAQEYLTYSERLATKGYVSEVQLEGDRFAVEKARIERDMARTELTVLDEFTKAKMVGSLDADIATAEAKLGAAEESHKLDVEELEDIEEQIEKCVIYAPQAGQVVYGNVQGGRGRTEVLIEEGTEVRERQVIIRLPDFGKMQVKARINEGKVSLLEEGMSVRIRLDAFADMELEGTVEEIDEFAAPTSWMSPNVKEYEAIIKIHDPPKGLRPGMTAEVKIEVERLSDVLQVPVQTVLEHGGKYFCAIPESGGFRTQEVELGANNDKFVVIGSGLQEGQPIVANVAAVRDELDLPKLSEGGGNAGSPAPPREERPGAAGTKPQPEAAASPSDAGRPSPAEIAGRILQRVDTDGDGVISAEEIQSIPEDRRSQMQAADADGDGKVSRSELTSGMKRMMERFGGQRPGAGGPGASPGGGGGPSR